MFNYIFSPENRAEIM